MYRRREVGYFCIVLTDTELSFDGLFCLCVTWITCVNHCFFHKYWASLIFLLNCKCWTRRLFATLKKLFALSTFNLLLFLSFDEKEKSRKRRRSQGNRKKYCIEVFILWILSDNFSPWCRSLFSIWGKGERQKIGRVYLYVIKTLPFATGNVRIRYSHFGG